jgi:hypothetical protein
MDPFPEEWELLSLFEVEPVISDRDVPWFYNLLTFETTRGDDHIKCEIEPGYEIIRLTWWQGRHEKLSLDLHWVRSLRVVTGSGQDYFVASFRDKTLLDLEFHLKPQICLRWGTSSECP